MDGFIMGSNHFPILSLFERDLEVEDSSTVIKKLIGTSSGRSSLKVCGGWGE